MERLSWSWEIIFPFISSNCSAREGMRVYETQVWDTRVVESVHGQPCHGRRKSVLGAATRLSFSPHPNAVCLPLGAEKGVTSAACPYA